MLPGHLFEHDSRDDGMMAVVWWLVEKGEGHPRRRLEGPLALSAVSVRPRGIPR